MTRAVLTVTLVVLSPALLFAGKKEDDKKNSDKKQHNAQIQAQIKALEAQLRQLEHAEPGLMKKIDDHVHALREKLAHQIEHERHERAELEHHEKAELHRINERFEHIIHNMRPHQVRRQLEATLQVLRESKLIWQGANPDYGGHWREANRLVDCADGRLREAIAHDTAYYRHRAALDVAGAKFELERALVYSAEHYGPGRPRAMPESQARSDRQLAAVIPVLDQTHHLLMHIDHEIKDYEQEKHALLRKRDAERKKVEEAFASKRHQLDEQIRQLEHEEKGLEQKKHEAREQARHQLRAAIGQLKHQIADLKKQLKK